MKKTPPSSKRRAIKRPKRRAKLPLVYVGYWDGSAHWREWSTYLDGRLYR